MTLTEYETTARKRATTASASSPDGRSMPLRLLAVVDGSEATNRVVDYLVGIAERREPLEVVILNVQEKSSDHRLRGYQNFKQRDVDERLIDDLGAPIVASVGQRLDKAGIRHTAKVRIGEPVQTILDCLAGERCDAVVIGDVSSAWQRWLAAMVGVSIGTSPAVRIAALADVPVVVAK